MSIFEGLHKVIRLVPAVLLVIPFTHAQERSSPPAIVSRSCSGCHGIDGKSQLPYVPRLAGQSSAYLERKLATFRIAGSSPVDEAIIRIVHIGSGGRDTGFSGSATVQMVGVANRMSDKDIREAAQWYAAQQPAHRKTGNAKAMEEGKSLYINGLQSRHLPACQTCHGTEARGTDIAPALAGQNAAYVLSRLAFFRAGDSDSPMRDVARSLESDQARAVAAYLQSH